MATVEKWAPYGVWLNITAENAGVTRISATKYQVKINVSWTSSGTWYWMKATANGTTKILYNGSGSSKGTSGTLTATYDISGKGAATKTVDVVFTNADPDSNWGTYKTKTVSFSVSVPAWPSYTISYNTNGGTGAPSSQTKYKDESLTISSTKPTRNYYSFQGWALSKALADAGTVYYTAGSTCGKNENLTLYAVWKANTYKISYNANGGTGAPSSQTKTYGTELALSTVKPTRTNYNFLGWATSASAATATYQPGATLSTTGITANLTLYAVWELAYTKPRIENLQLSRQRKVTETNDSGQTVTTYVNDDYGEYVRLEFSWETDKPNPTATLVCKPKVNDADTFETTLSGTNGELVIPVIGLDWDDDQTIFDSEITFTFTLTVADALGSNSITKTLSGAKFPIDIRRRGTGIAFNKPAELEGVADFGFTVRHNQGMLYPTLPENSELDDFRTPNTYVGKNVSTYNYTYANGAKTLKDLFGTGTFMFEVLSAGDNAVESRQTLQRITRCDKKKPLVFERWYYTNAWSEWTGGWITAELTSAFVAYGSTDETKAQNAPKYRKHGCVVEIRGAIAPTASMSYSMTQTTIFTLPEGYRPDSKISMVCQGSSTCVWMLEINSDGKVTFSRYRDGSTQTTATTAVWLPFQATFLV